MSDEKTQSEKAPAASSSTKSSGDGGNASVQEQMDAINEKGYFGIKVDPTPNEHYTASGVNKGLPTPETDPEQAAKAAEHAANVAAGTVEPEDQ
jgi:hypothetical protein